MARVTQPYSISLIADDLPREETMLQIANSLEQLTRISSDVQMRLNSRIKLTKERIDAVMKRLDNCTTKIEDLKGSKRATVVFSPAKYPVKEDNEVAMKSAIFSAISCEKLDPKPYKVKSNPKTFDPRTTLAEKQLYYNVRTTENKARSRGIKPPPSNAEDYDIGLGPLPDHLNSVSNILIFNTSEMPYMRKSAEPIKDSKRSRRRPVILDVEGKIGDAPTTILQAGYNDSFQQHQHEYAYTPGLGNVPEFDVPDLLPDLPGIADLSYSADLSSIAPSLPLLDSLPDIVPEVPAVETGGSESGLATAGAVPPPPPPPPPPPLVPAANPVEAAASSTGRPGATIPPPPPMLPPGIAEPAKMDTPTDGATVVPKAATEPAEIGYTARSTLMDAIREAGGVSNFKFRSAEELKRQRKVEREREKEGMALPAAAGPGDLMGDLTRALLLRRRGISGRTDRSDSADHTEGIPPPKADLSTAMAKLADVIPAPKDRSASTDHVSEAESNGSWDSD